MEMDYGSFVPGSGYFTPKNAKLQDNYHLASLTCVGASLKNGVRCVGYDNGDNSVVIEASIALTEGGLVNGVPTVATASYKFLRSFDGKPAPPQTPGPWACSVGPFAAPPPAPSKPSVERHLSCGATAAQIRLAVGRAGSFTDVSLMDNYHISRDLTCVGFTLSDPVHCLGYDNGGPALVEATISPPPTTAADTKVKNTAAYTFLRSFDGKPAPPQTPGPWPCTLSGDGDDGGNHHGDGH